MKWTRPSGTEIETNDEKSTIEACEKMGWKELKEKAAKKEPKKAAKKDDDKESE